MTNRFLNLLVILALSLALFACVPPKTRKNSFFPQVGMDEETLIRNWGRGGHSSSYSSKYGTTRYIWYTETMMGVLPGCSSQVARGNIFYYGCVLVGIEGGKIVSISYH